MVHIYTSVSFTRYCSNKVKLRWEIFHSCYEPFLSDSDIERILKIDRYSKNKVAQFFLTHSVCTGYITADHSRMGMNTTYPLQYT